MLFTALVAAVLALPVSAPAAQSQASRPKYKIHWLLGHPNLDFFEEAAASFKKEIERETHGDIQVEIVTTQETGSGAEIGSLVAKGEAEMGHSFVDVMGALEPRLYAYEAPYLFRDYRHMEGVLEGPIGQEMLDGLAAKHVAGLSFTYSGGANGVATVDRELRAPEDLKGLRVGVYGDPAAEAWLKSLGAIPVPVGHRNETIAELADQKKIDAVIVTWRNFQQAKLESRFKYFNMAGSSYLVSVTYVNDAFFASLPPEYRDLIRRVSREAGRVERAKTIELNESAKLAMTGKGVRPVYLSAKGAARFAAALEPALAQIDGMVGKGLLGRIRAAADGPELPSSFSKSAGR